MNLSGLGRNQLSAIHAAVHLYGHRIEIVLPIARSAYRQVPVKDFHLSPFQWMLRFEEHLPRRRRLRLVEPPCTAANDSERAP